MITVLLSSLAAVAGLMLVGWIISVIAKDASIVDILWGLAFVAITWAAFAAGHGAPGRSVLLAVLVTVWGVRLATYLAWRNLGKGEDYRYRAMRKHKPNFVHWSLYGVFGLQAVLAYVVSLPVQIAMQDRTPVAIGPLAYIGAALWAVGMFFETTGDLQLARFKADPANKGKVMDRGLWSLTRHPNYFGDFCVWWGLFVVAAETGTALIGVVGPIAMTVLLTRVSGKALLERTIGRRRPGYEEYVARTNGFFPGPPRKQSV